ncbi:hypothetical protein LZC95_52515 [Pendulispora brunnea]|uniref:Uncharacterized protein n=1 Tax=Pendulispora brunnea TaxID=2905690 RepID=A0ABZ2KDU8_9BACT
MIKRLFVGLVLGLVMGSLVAAVVVKGLGLTLFSPALAYVFAAATGVIVGLVAGKPIWAQGGQIEAGLKAGFGALVAGGLMYAMRRWLQLDVDLSGFGAGAGSVSELPATSLPLIAAVLAGFYSADNTPEPAGEGKTESKPRLATKKDGPKTRIASSEDDEDDAADVLPGKRTKR